jgi:hypothetical protein
LHHGGYKSGFPPRLYYRFDFSAIEPWCIDASNRRAKRDFLHGVEQWCTEMMQVAWHRHQSESHQADCDATVALRGGGVGPADNAMRGVIF